MHIIFCTTAKTIVFYLDVFWNESRNESFWNESFFASYIASILNNNKKPCFLFTFCYLLPCIEVKVKHFRSRSKFEHVCHGVFNSRTWLCRVNSLKRFTSLPTSVIRGISTGCWMQWIKILSRARSTLP